LEPFHCLPKKLNKNLVHRNTSVRRDESGCPMQISGQPKRHLHRLPHTLTSPPREGLFFTDLSLDKIKFSQYPFI